MKIALVQMNSKLDYQENLEFIRKVASEAKDQGAKALFLPECFYSMSDGTKPTPYLIEEGNEHHQNIINLAKDNEMALVGGSAATLLNGKVVNRAFNIGPDGKSLGDYDKIHLFSCDIKKEDSRKSIDEADIYHAGNEPKLIEYLGVKIGIGICFDLRYPEMAREYIHQGAKILTFASAFTVPTGKAHWATLIRARAIENQCFVIASAQWGRHNDRIQTYGHSMVVDPWGEVLVDAKEGESLHIVDLNLDRIDEVRRSVKVFKSI